jgi:hypothetical protein
LGDRQLVVRSGLQELVVRDLLEGPPSPDHDLDASLQAAFARPLVQELRAAREVVEPARLAVYEPSPATFQALASAVTAYDLGRSSQALAGGPQWTDDKLAWLDRTSSGNSLVRELLAVRQLVRAARLARPDDTAVLRSALEGYHQVARCGHLA